MLKLYGGYKKMVLYVQLVTYLKNDEDPSCETQNVLILKLKTSNNTKLSFQWGVHGGLQSIL